MIFEWGFVNFLNNALSWCKCSNIPVNNCCSCSTYLTHRSLFGLCFWSIIWQSVKWQLSLFKNTEWNKDNFISKADTFVYNSFMKWNFRCSLLFRLLKRPQIAVKKARSHIERASLKYLTTYPFPMGKPLIPYRSDRKRCKVLPLLSQRTSE
jgi:hypothetical protein